MNPSSDVRTDIGWNRPAAPRMGLLVAVLAITLGLGVLAVGAGLSMIAVDLADTTDDWHGFGIFLGAVAAIPGSAVVVLAGTALRFRRTAPHRTRVLAYVLGALLLGSTLLIGSLGTLVSLPFAAWGLSLVGAAAMVRGTAPSSSR